MSLIGYARVSTAQQRDEETIEVQKQLMTDWEKAGHTITTIRQDGGISGGDANISRRVGLSEAFACLENEKGVDGLLIYKLDRLARDLYWQEYLIKKIQGLNKQILSVADPPEIFQDGDPMRKAFRQFLGIMNGLEKAYIAMRMGGGRTYKAMQGGFAGATVPFSHASAVRGIGLGSGLLVVLLWSYLRRPPLHYAINFSLSSWLLLPLAGHSLD